MTLPPSFLTSWPAAAAEPPGGSQPGCHVYKFDPKLTCRNDIVDNQDLRAGLDGVGLNLEKVFAVLLLVAGRLAFARQLALLTHRGKAAAEPQSQTGAEQEAASLETDNHIGLFEVVGYVQLESAKQRLVEGRVGEDRQDVLEQDTRRGKVGELAQRRLELCLEGRKFLQ